MKVKNDWKWFLKSHTYLKIDSIVVDWWLKLSTNWQKQVDDRQGPKFQILVVKWQQVIANQQHMVIERHN